MKKLIVAITLSVVASAAAASQIRVEFETTVTQAYNLVDLTTSIIDPVSGRFSITFDDTKNLISDSDQYGPYSNFDAPWITTPVSSKIPFGAIVVPPYPQPIFYNSFTIGETGIVNAVPVHPLYGPGYASQGFGFDQFLNSSFPYSGQANSYHLQIVLDRALPLDGFTPLSTLDFLRSFVGNDVALGTTRLYEDYRLKQFNTLNEGYRYTDNALKVISVTDLSTPVPEPTTASLTVLALLIAVVRPRRPRSGRAQAR